MTVVVAPRWPPRVDKVSLLCYNSAKDNKKEDSRMTVWLKEGVLGSLAPETRRCKGRLVDLYAKWGRDFHITSKGEGNHNRASCHYEGQALDFKRQAMSKSFIVTACGKNFDIVEYTDQRDIFHVEYDPK